MHKTRLWLMVFAALTCALSAASLYVHYNLLTDASYTSFCDISDTVSCEAVYESAYGSVRGVPVAAGGVIWSALVLLLAAHGMRRPKSDEAARVAEYVFLLSVVGLASVLYLGYASLFVLKQVCVLCAGTYVTVFGTFFVAAGATTMPFRTLPARAFRDLRGLTASPAALALALVWVAGAGSLVAFFPRTDVTASAAPEATAASSHEEGAAEGAETQTAAAGPLTGSQRAEFERWYTQQGIVPITVPSEGARVLIVKFNDYLCPPCRQTFMEYKPVLAKFEASHPGQVRFVTRDFPLEPECNTGGSHVAACEAAAAVRMARVNNRAAAFEDWLFDNQARMTPEFVRQGASQIGGVTDFDAQYPRVLEQVRADVKYGQSLGVTSTPTFFINGRMVQGGLEPQFFEAAIEYELARAQAPKP